MRRYRILSLCLALVLLCTACGGGKARASSMHLRRADGMVDVWDDAGESLALLENLGLYSGYQVDTREESYAWIDLDKVKLTKLDENSQAEIEQDGRELTILLHSGGLFFHVTEPLAKDESLTVRASTMAVGIRGTCGWVANDGHGGVLAALLEGSVSIQTDAGDTATLEAGQKAVLSASGLLEISSLRADEIPDFVRSEPDIPMPELSMAPVLPLLPEDGIAREVVEVADPAALDALTAAGIASNTELHLHGGTYNVGSLSLDGLSNVSILGDGTTRLVSNWGGDRILTADGSENLILYGLSLGHDLSEDGGCDAGVISAWGVTNLQIIGCDIYGCGVVGLSGSGSVTMVNSVVRDCSESGVFWSGGTLRAVDCTFRGNSYLCTQCPLFHVGEETSVSLEDCVLTDNSSFAKFGRMAAPEESPSGWNTDPGDACVERGVTESGNGWQQGTTP